MATVNDMFDSVTKEQSFYREDAKSTKGSKFAPYTKGEYFGHITEVDSKILDVKGGQYRARLFEVPSHTYKGSKALIDDDIELTYLSCPDEIDSYSANIAIRLYIEEHILNITRDKEHWDLHTYYKAFGKKHPVTKELETQIAIKLTIIREKEHGKDKRAVKRS